MELLPLEYGIALYNPNKEIEVVSISILVWLGDHQELNEISWIYSNACRKCTMKKDENDNWILRNKKEAQLNYLTMWNIWNEIGQKQIAYEMSKDLKQHIGEVSNLINNYINNI
jgi:hypothetical protein